MSDPTRESPFAPAIISQLVGLIEGPRRPVVLVDGGSGAGKSTLADQLAAALPAELVRLEQIYPGWDGLEAASEAVHTNILAANNPGWREWDWTLAAPGESHRIDPSKALIIEGSGSLSRENRRLATFGIWLRLDAGTRRDRALARDGDRYAPQWVRWAAQEAAFVERERPEERADALVDVSTGRLVLNTAK